MQKVEQNLNSGSALIGLSGTGPWLWTERTFGPSVGAKKKIVIKKITV